MNRTVLFTSIGIGVAVVAVAVYFFFFRGAAAGNADAENSALIRRVVKAERKDLKIEVSATGTVQPIFKVDIKSKASGTILSLKLNEGDFIKRGQIVAMIEKTDNLSSYNQAKANYDLTMATLKQVQTSTERKKDLFSQKLLSVEEMDLAALELERAKAQLVSARAVYDQALTRLNDTSVPSPIDGLVLDKPVDEGQVISSATSSVSGGTTILTVADMRKVFINAAVDEVDIGKITIGQPAKVVADAYPDESFSGKVLRIDPLATVEQNVTRFAVVIEVDNPNYRLKAGMNTTVTIVAADRRNVVVVPIEALRDPRNPPTAAEGGAVAGGGQGRRGAGDGQSGQGGGQSGAQGNSNRAERQGGGDGQGRRDFASLPDSVKQKIRERRAMRDSVMSAVASDSAAGRPMNKRVAMVKDASGDFKPRLVEIGTTNYDEAEVVSGLVEGDELQITTFSRARMQGQQFRQNIQSSQGLGGNPQQQRQVRQSTR